MGSLPGFAVDLQGIRTMRGGHDAEPWCDVVYKD